ncbi:MAG: hypothetical protein HC767_11925 [Akkermansiaceae bacterium]|nr:hypothetical protein [Akkermansiaceae bacterium]
MLFLLTRIQQHIGRVGVVLASPVRIMLVLLQLQRMVSGVAASEQKHCQICAAQMGTCMVGVTTGQGSAQPGKAIPHSQNAAPVVPGRSMSGNQQVIVVGTESREGMTDLLTHTAGGEGVKVVVVERVAEGVDEVVAGDLLSATQETESSIEPSPTARKAKPIL